MTAIYLLPCINILLPSITQRPSPPYGRRSKGLRPKTLLLIVLQLLVSSNRSTTFKCYLNFGVVVKKSLLSKFPPIHNLHSETILYSLLLRLRSYFSTQHQRLFGPPQFMVRKIDGVSEGDMRNSGDKISFYTPRLSAVQCLNLVSCISSW